MKKNSKTKKRKTTSRENRRYRLHQKIKNIVKYSSKSKEIFVFQDDEQLFKNKYILELRDKFYYNVQLEAVKQNVYNLIQTGLESPDKVTLHRVPGKKSHAITFFNSLAESDENLVTKTFEHKFTYAGKLSKVENLQGVDTKDLDTINYDYHIISF